MKRLLLLLCISVVSQIAMGQWRFTVTLSTSGCGNSMEEKIAWKAAEQQVNYWMGKGNVTFQSKMECEQARQSIVSQSYNVGNCKLRYITSPCTGSGGLSGSVDALGVSKGSGFYSTNAANEIRDWSNDDMERMLALDKDYKPLEPTSVTTGDANFDNARNGIDPNMTFVSINMREGGSSRVISEDLLPIKERPADMTKVKNCLDRIGKDGIPQFETAEEFIQWTKNKFQEATGFDINVIASKFEKSEEELQALANYREVFNLLMDKAYNLNELIWKDNHSEERKAYEMAVLMDDCYKDSEHEYISQTNYQKIYTAEFPDENPMKVVSKMIDDLDGIAGFHAELYYNKNLDEYTIAFEGSQFHLIDEPVDFLKDWVATNLYQGIGGVPAQYQMAAYIASALPQGVNINFTGHSLGGGLASVAGAISGRPTYTFNAEGINDNVIRTFNLGDRKSFDNIKAYQANNDALTFFQEGGGKKSAEYAINPLTINPKNAKPIVSNYIAASSIGNKEVVKSGGLHMRKPMVKYFANEWGKSIRTLTTLSNERSKVRMQTIGSIQINMQ